MSDDDRHEVARRGAPAGREALPDRARTVRLLTVTAGCIVASAVVLVAVLLTA
jgi:hypothetical protein